MVILAFHFPYVNDAILAWGSISNKHVLIPLQNLICTLGHLCSTTMLQLQWCIIVYGITLSGNCNSCNMGMTLGLISVKSGFIGKPYLGHIERPPNKMLPPVKAEVLAHAYQQCHFLINTHYTSWKAHTLEISGLCSPQKLLNNTLDAGFMENKSWYRYISRASDILDEFGLTGKTRHRICISASSS